MTNKQIGGRGKKAPYETTHVRIPVDLKPQVELLIEEFRNNGNTVLEKDSNKLIEDESIKHRKLLDFVIEDFKKNGLYIGEDSKLKPRLNLSVLREEAFRIGGNLAKTARTKKELATILLARIYGIDSDEVNLD